MFFFFFDDFEEFLKQCLYSDESYDKDKALGTYMVDYYLPKGSRRLNYPERTVIEVKEKLTSGTTRNARWRADKLRGEFGINCYVLMSHDIPNEAVPLKTSKNKQDVFMLVEDYEKLQSLISKYGTVLFEGDVQWKNRREGIISRASYDYKFGRNTFFLGAGVSRDAGLLSWSKLIDSMVAALREMKEISINDLDALKNDCREDYFGQSALSETIMQG